MRFIPDGFQTVTPYLFCDDPSALARWLEAAFDGEEQGRTVVNGRIANLQIKIGTAMLMLAEADERYPAKPSAFYIYVDDADASQQRALEAGATLEMAVMDMPYGDRQGGVIDLAGNIWWVSQRLIDEPYSH